MAMVPRLLEVGLHGFQGFQYEDGMHYARICRMKTREGAALIIMGGVSVTRTLPYGIPDDVRRELRWLVENGPPTGLFLGASSSITPGVPWRNVQTLVEGLAYYRQRVDRSREGGGMTDIFGIVPPMTTPCATHAGCKASWRPTSAWA